MVYIPPINNKLGPTDMAPMASKTCVLNQYVARLFLKSVGKGSYLRTPAYTSFLGLVEKTLGMSLQYPLHSRHVSFPVVLRNDAI